MYKMLIPPDQSGYSVQDGSEVLRQQLDGGRGRIRADILNASRKINCQWSVGPEDYKYLRSFYNVNKARAFEIDLYLDEPILTTHTANFIPDTFGLVSQSGLTFIVGCQIEAEPIDTLAYDESFIDLIDIYGSPEAAIEIINLLEKLTNIDLPEIA